MDDYLNMLSSSTHSMLSSRPTPGIDPVLQELSFSAESTPISAHSARSSSPRSSSGDVSVFGSEFGQEGEDSEQVNAQSQPLTTPARPTTGGKQPRMHFFKTPVNPQAVNPFPGDLDAELAASDEEPEVPPQIVPSTLVQFAEDYGRANSLSEDIITAAKSFANVSTHVYNLKLLLTHSCCHSAAYSYRKGNRMWCYSIIYPRQKKNNSKL